MWFKKNIPFLIVFTWCCISIPVSVCAEMENRTLTFLLTANLNGRFLTTADNQDEQDPMLIIAQSLVAERQRRRVDLYLDLGNAFFPGILSRYSWGSVMMDYLDDFGCDATLISSQDLKIGISNLELIHKGKGTQLLSADIREKGKPVFTPYIIREIHGKTFAFIGISSKNGYFDIAETELRDISFIEADEALNDILTEISREKIDYVILLSGLSTDDNLTLMDRNKSISLCISGGDTSGETYSVKASRIDLDSGRSLVTLTSADGYYILSLTVGDSIQVNSLDLKTPSFQPTADSRYSEFVQRLTIWKQKFETEGKEEIATELKENIRLDNEKVANLLRDRFNAEIAILDSNSILPGLLSTDVTYSDILRIVRNEHPIFTFKLTGRELKQISKDAEGMIITGTDGVNVQGYPIEDGRKYLLCASQLVYDQIKQKFGREIPYKNSWRTLSDEIIDDLEGDRVIMANNFDYLDNRFRILADIRLSNFYDQSTISGGDNPDIPPGMPANTYHKWGLEDSIDVTVYNQHHKVVFTPYIFYIRQDEKYLQNLLRGTLFYTYNLNPVIKPYYKSQIDTVVVETSGQRPILLRNTTGVSFDTSHIDGKLGLGFEKQTQDPVKPMSAGFEIIFDANHDILRYFTYRFHLDSFYSIRQEGSEGHRLSANITNAISFKLNSFAAFSIQHKYFYYSSLENPNKYQDSQVLMSLDLKTGFKLF